MKTLVSALMLLSLSSVALAETREYSKVSSSESIVVIDEEGAEYTQAAAYVDGVENDQFVKDLLKDPESPLYKLVKEIEKENCDAESTPDNSWIDACGEVTITKEVRTSFGRGGWASAGAQYTLFVGFTSDGSGHFYDATHMVLINESVEAQTDEEGGNYAGKLLKTLSFAGIKKLDI